MLSLPPSVRVFVARGPTDLRKGFDGLEGLAREVIEQDPMSGHLFVFFNRRRDRVKILVWDRTGYVLLYKRLERGRFEIGTLDFGDAESVEVLSSDLMLLLDGIDMRSARRLPRYEDRVSRKVRRLLH